MTSSSEAAPRATGTATMEPDSRAAIDAQELDAAHTEQMNDDSNFERPRWSPPAPPPPPPPQPRRSWLDVPIARDGDERRVAGVVAGVSSAYGFDRRTTRIAVALAALVIPGLFAVYVAGMIFLPGSKDEPRTLRAIATDPRRRPLFIVLAILGLATGFGSWALWGGFGWGFALLLIGFLLWLSPNLGATATGGPDPVDGPMARSTPNASPRTKRHRRRRYPIQAVSLAVVSVGVLVIGIGNSNDWWNITRYGSLIGSMLTLIASTVAGAVINRSWLGVPMLVLLAVTSVGLVITHPNLEGDIGERTFRPITLAEAQDSQHLAVGRLTVDLTSLALDEQPLPIEASVGYGQVRVTVPADAELRIVSDLNAGHIVVNGEEILEGFHREDVTIIPALTPDGAAHTIVLDLAVGGGEIEITQAN